MKDTSKEARINIYIHLVQNFTYVPSTYVSTHREIRLKIYAEDFKNVNALFVLYSVCGREWRRPRTTPGDDHLGQFIRIKFQIVVCRSRRDVVQFFLDRMVAAGTNEKVHVVCVFRQEVLRVDRVQVRDRDYECCRAEG